MKKLLVLIITMMFLFFCIDINADEVKILIYGSDDEYLTYYNSSEYVTIPTEFDFKETEFRGVWVSTFVSDIPSYTTEEKFKADATEMLDILEYYNYNALIFHVRTHNNALYDSNYNPRASWWRSVDFQKFDPLKWLIDETHKRGMEFHAWMNPYRVQYGSTTYKAESYPSSNPASNPENLLYEDGSTSKTTILNPAKEVVKSFLVQTCMEVVRKYDVDAIHFDDYFYVSGVDDDKDYQNNNPNGLSKADWRRTQIDDFIRRLSNQLKLYNNQNGKSVQLGISPGGIYKNGNGKVEYDENGTAITNGSLTNGGEHYGEYLYSDTKKWIDNEWIDYILPQCYHGMEQKYFASLIDWWSAVVKNKKVNFYVGIGLYGPGSYWDRHDELKNQFFFMNKHDNVHGFAIYKFSNLKSAYKKTSTLKASQVSPLYQLAWDKKCLPAVIERFDYGTPEKVENLKISKNENGYELSFDKVDTNKFYAVYQSEDGIIDVKNLVEITSGETLKNRTVINVESDLKKEYKFTVVPLSESNVCGEGNTISTTDLSYKVEFIDEEGKVLATEYSESGKVSEPELVVPDGMIVSYSHSLDEINDNIKITVKFISGVKKITFEYLGKDGSIKQVTKDFIVGELIVYPEIPIVDGYKFINFEKREENYYVAYYEKIVYKVDFLDKNGDIILTQSIAHNEEIVEYPTLSEVEGYKFVGWDYQGKVTSDLTVKPIYEVIKLNVVFVNNFEEVIDTIEVEYGHDLDMIKAEEVDGYKFIGYFVNENEVTELTNITSDITVTLTYQETTGCKSGTIQSVFYLLSVLGLTFILKKKKY